MYVGGRPEAQPQVDGGLELTAIQGMQRCLRNPPTTLFTGGHSLRQRHPFRGTLEEGCGPKFVGVFPLIFPFKKSLFPRLLLTFFHIISTLLHSFPTQYSIIQSNWGKTKRRLSKSFMFTLTKYIIHSSLLYTCKHTLTFSHKLPLTPSSPSIQSYWFYLRSVPQLHSSLLLLQATASLKGPFSLTGTSTLTGLFGAPPPTASVLCTLPI